MERAAYQPMDYSVYDNGFVPMEFGLQNSGATCWFNSLLQMMLGLPALNRILLEREQSLRNNPFACGYIKLIRATLPGNESVDPLDYSEIISSSTHILGSMLTQARSKNIRSSMGVGQECVDEGFITFIELLDCPHVERLFSNVYELIIDCTGCNKKVSSIRDKSFRMQMFTQVPLESEYKFCNYLRVHPSEVDFFKCDCGHAMAKFQRIEKLKMLREIVVIIFNKFYTKDVRFFPQELTFKSTGNKSLDYKLVGKIDHSGTRLSGHYWAHSIRGEEWFCLNDTSVTKGNPLPTSSTFMVVYHMV